MRLKHFEYITLVKELYKKKLSNNELCPLLTHSTPGNVRQECANVYRERYEKKDEPALRAFFGAAEHGRRFLTVIEEFNVNKFKSLNDYFKGGGKKGINDKNLELLAWLIDFPHRPYISDNNILLSEEEIACLKEPEIYSGPDEPEKDPKRIEPSKPEVEVIPGNDYGPNEPLENPEGVEPLKPEGRVEGIRENDPGDKPIDNPSLLPLSTDLKSNKWSTASKRSVIIALILILVTGGTYTTLQVIGQQHRCMYWNGDEYVPVSCNEDPNDRVFLPLDVKKMKNFQRITQKDTITDQSIGKIYYIKDNNKIEYYTYSGNYPKDLNRYVKKLSRRIFEKDSLNRKLPD